MDAYPFNEMGAVLVAVRDSLRVSVIKAVVFLIIVLGVAFAWGMLWQDYPRAREGLFSRRIDSYLPDLAALRPELLRSSKEGDRYLAYYHLIEREAPGTAGVNEALGYCYYYSGDSHRAVRYFEQALRSTPDSFIARYNLGVIYYQKKDFERALGYFQQAVSLPESRVFSYGIGSKVFSQFRVVRKVTSVEALVRLRREYDDAKRFIKVCMEKQGKAGELLILAMRYNDLRQAWTQYGGEPSTMELIVF